MKVDCKPDFPVSNESCREATGKTLDQWYAALDKQGGAAQKRREAINWLYEQTAKNAWWSTTIWVEYERAKGIVNRKDGLIEGYNICVTKSINASLSDVFAAMSEPAALQTWFGDKVVADVADKGAFRDDAGNTGEFLRVREDKDLRFTWRNKDMASTTQVDVALAAKGIDKTGVTLTHARLQNRGEADGLRVAWSAALDRLKSMLED